MTNQLIRFVLVGSLATALHTVVVWLCEALMPSLHLNVSNVIGFLCAFPVSYWGQRSFTFGHDGRHRPALSKVRGVAIVWPDYQQRCRLFDGQIV